MKISASLRIENGQIVGPHGVYEGDIIIQGGKILAITSIDEERQQYDCEHVVDATDKYVLPGLIDTHSDAIEREIQPRPNSIFPLEMAMNELEKKLASVGITTIYHSVCSSDGTPVRNDEIVEQIIRFAAAKRQQSAMVRHRTHLRYEITNMPGLEMVRALLDRDEIDLLSLMDHTPGQGQYTDRDVYLNYMMGTEHMTLEEAEATLQQIEAHKAKVDWTRIEEIVRYAQSKGVVTASHDDDTTGKVDWMRKLGVGISEFPVNLDAALYAKSQGMQVSVGAPNIVRGSSHSKNMKAMDAVQAGAADLLCSDYHPSSMLPAVFKIAESCKTLAEAVSMVTLNPAIAVGIDDMYGSIEPGKWADLLLVEMHEGYPLVRKTFVGGEAVYESSFFNGKKVMA